MIRFEIKVCVISMELTRAPTQSHSRPYWVMAFLVGISIALERTTLVDSCIGSLVIRNSWGGLSEKTIHGSMLTSCIHFRIIAMALNVHASGRQDLPWVCEMEFSS